MKLLAKLLLIAVALAIVFAAGFALCGQWFQRLLSPENTAQWFSHMKPVAWIVAIALLVSDLLLPIPATGVMAALGAVYGVALGAAVAATGSVLSAVAGYGLARLIGLKAGRFIADPKELERFRAFFDRWGGAAIIVSRILPVLPEVMSVLAGLARMTFPRFLAAVLLGTIPTCVLFAWIGAASARQPGSGILLAVLIPVLLWPLFLRLIRPRTPPR